MPELPEVETIRRGLESAVINKQIVDLQVTKPKLLRNQRAYFLNTLKNNSISSINRIGKLLIFVLADEQNYLLVHLKMTGQLIYTKGNQMVAGGHKQAIEGELPNKYSHIIFHFADDSKLFFNDMRQFGYMELVEDVELIIKKYGIEPGTKNFTWVNFQKIFVNRKITIKSLLLNQQIVSGIGNIYADEICYRAKVRPDRKVNTLTVVEKKKIFTATKYIIEKAVEKRGTTFSDYRDTSGQPGNFVKFLKVYGRDGQKCMGCRQENIKKVKLGGRGTHFCSRCQR
ncbi:bifunctional DNA-formamidopyrimidine glycosylase/DNA-(apurinic or apyrimidinic site) lyase [Candidatus Parcubacteria bacterium]|jgi:formamidopyrimidine-DNA glycosylase|nr:bifunctional DNA-formamidopyrimidine glycosylase/DNA-(apurinic or apyrimidinic site) lyase [Candidatus Parcubacteria bacterium]